MTRSSSLRRARVVTLALALGVAPVAAPVLAGLFPVAAEARPGFGGSFGSRGSRTFSAPPSTATNPGGASPFTRTLTPRQSPSYAPAYGGGYGGVARAHPFGAGFAGGLLGVGLAGMLFGHGFFGGGYGYGGGFGGSGLLGLLIQLAILFFVGRWLYRRFVGGRAMAGRSGGPGAVPFAAGGVTGGGVIGGSGGAIPITPADYGQFEQALLDIQQAWSMQDLRALSRFATPEMVSYFSEQLTDLSSRNLRNAVSAVRMEHGDLSEAWSENNREFATVAMRYSVIDVTTDLTGRVVDGSPNERQTVTELWTFVRARGGSWLLSAIQQAR